MHPMLNIAVRAARAAGNIIARNLGHTELFSVEEKRKDDLVTDIDKDAFREATAGMLKAYGEEYPGVKALLETIARLQEK